MFTSRFWIGLVLLGTGGAVTALSLAAARKAGGGTFIAPIGLMVWGMALMFSAAQHVPRRSSQRSLDIPQIAGMPCAECGRTIHVILQGILCERCKAAIHRDCQAAHVLRAHLSATDHPYREMP
jgi:hypothetical protein